MWRPRRGTGIVTIIRSYGEVDLLSAQQNDLPVLMDVQRMDGTFADFAGLTPACMSKTRR